nr:hypothetical protein HK105_005437 [Polyrhizophydium stewartii]
MPTQPQPCYVAGLPDELLVHVFSNLDADEMRAALGVCRRWKSVISDDHCWKLALRNYFGSLPLSWRTEYLRRLALARAWRKSKQGVQFEPRIGRIDEIFVDSNENRVFVASLQKGMASIHSSATGRSERAAVHASDDQSALEVGAIKIDKMRVAIGYLTGQVALMSNIRDKQRYSRRMLNGFHHGPVISLAWLPGVMSLLLSGSVDGQIRIWDVDSGECVRVLTGDDSRIVHIAVDQHNHVVASTGMGNCPSLSGSSTLVSGNASGSVRIWTIPDLARAGNVPECVPELVKPVRTFVSLHLAPITALFLDEAKLVTASGDGKIKIIDILTGEILRQLAIKLSRSPWMDMDDESHQNVRCLWASSHTLIATAGGAVKFWSFEPGSLASTPNKKKRNSRGATRMGSSSTLGGSRAGRIGFSREDLVEIDDDVHQIRREIDAERTELAFMRHQFREFNGAATSDMSEEEMLRLALLMSADQLQEDERRRSMWDEWDEDDDDADQFGDSTLDPELAQYISPGMRGATGHALAAYMEDLDLDARSGSAGSAGAGARRRIGGGS